MSQATITDLSDNDESLTPVFTDNRSLREKLAADHREWRPTQPEYECPSVIDGLVLERGTYCSKFGKEHHTARLLTRDNVVWSVIGLHGYLQSELDRKDPGVGDYAAIAFLGTKPAKREGESDSFVYNLEVERNPSGQAVAEGGDTSLTVADPPLAVSEVEQQTAEVPDDDIPY